MLAETADAMAALVRSVVGPLSADGIDVEVSGRRILNPTPPHVDIYPGDPSRSNEARGMGEMYGEDMWTVRVRLGVTDYEENQDLLLEFMDETSDFCIPMAILDDPGLGGLAASMDVRTFSGTVLYPDINGIATHIGCEWGFLVIPARS